MFGVIVFSVLFLIGVILLVIECWKLYLNQTKLKAYAHAKGLPILGNIIELLKCDDQDIINFPNRLVGNCEGAINYTWMGPFLFMCIWEPNVIESILNSEKTLKKGYMYGFLRNKFGILTADPSTWRPHRKVLSPTLGQKMVSSFIPVFNEKFQKMVNLMERDIGHTVDMHRLMFKASTDSVFKSTFEIDWSMQNEYGDKYFDGFCTIFKHAQMRAHSIFLKWDALYKFTKYYQIDNILFTLFYQLIDSILFAKKIELADKLIQGVDELAQVKDTKSSNFLQTCLQMEKDQKFNSAEVFDEIQIILIGSADTTASTLNSTILMLAIHPHYQDLVLDELRSIFADFDEPVTKAHLPKMNFMELIIKESLRLFPIGPFLARECTSDFELNGGVIPSGTQIVLNVLYLHRNPKFWGSNANEFWPERFLPENTANQHAYQYIPFSAGPRSCLGTRYAWTSLKVVL